ncbi:glycosyltransferase family 4 protein [Parafilimonas sp.]|uniref:glycosyltransferase family 4 protein n=1 Tax=Parafilimonas sp. TaxID=1969739 RepID=UPI0039E5BD38
MKIAYLALNDPLDKRSWSGTTYYIAKALQKNGNEVNFLGPVKPPKWLDKTLRAMAKATRIIFRREYITKYSLLLSWYTAKQFNKKLKERNYDCICAPAASVELGFLKTNLPVIYITDATFELMSNYDYSEFDKMFWFSKIEGNLLEKHALKKSTAIIYPSTWAAESAVKDYHIANNKVFIAPFGANIDLIPDRKIIYKKLENKQLTLLFLAVDWERKGGSIAFDVLKNLIYTHGIQAKLIVCGCVPPSHIAHPNMEVIPFLDKNNKDDYKKFVEIMSCVHFLLVPTRADCSLLVGCEANAYGVPAITTETGGVPEIVKDGINGYCLPYSAPGSTYAALISELFINEEKYQQLVASSRQRFEEHLNWQKWSESFNEIYENKVAKKEPALSLN